MIRTDSAWHRQPPVQKGDLGEDIVQRIFERVGWQCYKPASAGAHAIDFICIKNNETFYLEVKTKRLRKLYPDTGFPLRNYKTYKELSKNEGKRIYIAFVDIGAMQVYGNFLDVLDMPRIVKYNRDGHTYTKLYPCNDMDYRKGEDIRFFPRPAMNVIADLREMNLTDDELRILRQMV